jgi:glycosyltransferase involved in cell wall biosynthesis
MLTSSRTLPSLNLPLQLSPARGSARVRVLHIGKFYPPEHGGLASHVHELVSELRDSVDQSVVVASKTRQTSRETVDGIPVNRLGALLDFCGAPVCPGMIKAIRSAEADILHIHLPNPIAIMAYLASGFSGKLVFTYHSDIVRQKLLGSAFSTILHRALNRSDAIIATSENYLKTSHVL